MGNKIGEGVFPIPYSDDVFPMAQGWNSEHPIFQRIVSKYVAPTIIEVGTWHGASAIQMARNLPNGMGRIYCVDTWLGALEFWTTHKDTPERDLMLKHGYPQVYYHFLRCVQAAGVERYITPIPMPSLMAARYLSSEKVQADVIYIDGSHEYDDVKADIAAYMPLLRTGGTMFGDDFSAFEGVARAVEETFGRTFALEDKNFWIIEKPTS
jgi:predicted O-methyltransferase YrrM